MDYASASLGERALGHGEPIRVKAPANTPWDYTLFGDKTPAATRALEHTYDLSFHMLADEGRAFNRWVVNDQSWPKVEPIMDGPAG